MKSLTPDKIAAPFARYAHGVEVPAGHRILRTSGQLGQGADGVVPIGADAQARMCFDTIAVILAEAGMDATHIFHIGAYVTDRAHMADYMAARDSFLHARTALPTSTLMIVSGFTRPEFVVEVEVWAAAP